MTPKLSTIPTLVVTFLLAGPDSGLSATPGSGPAERTVSAPAADSLQLTWLSVTNWLLEAGNTRVLTDGYITRVPTDVAWGADGAPSHWTPDTAAVRRVADALLPERRLDWIVVGHAHFDHAFDVAAWARLTGARVMGASTVCLQIQAQGLPAERCVSVEGGESMRLADDLEVRVVRWEHSGTPDGPAGPLLHVPLELTGVPEPDPETGGLDPGISDDFPNGGGARAYLFLLDSGGDGRTSVFWSNTGNAATLAKPLEDPRGLLDSLGVDPGDLRVAPRDGGSALGDLARVLEEESISSVDLWMGMAGPSEARVVVPVLRPDFVIPHHWDDFTAPFFRGVTRSYPTERREGVFRELGVTLMPPEEYGDRFLLTPGGLERAGSAREALGIGAPLSR